MSGSSLSSRSVGVAGLLGAVLMASVGLAAPASAAPATTVDLGHASTYAVLSGASVANTVNGAGAPHTTLRGDLGVNPNTQPTGFPPGIVTGTTRVGSTATPAYNDLVTAYNAVSARTGGAPLPGDLIGQTLVPGLYSNAGAVANTGTVTLDGRGDTNAVFVFQVGGALSMAALSHVTLINGALASRVFWQVNGAAAVGANAKFAGTIMALNAIAIGAGTEINGRALALNGAISLDSNEFYSAPPAVTIAGGSTAITTNPTPTISGTTDVGAGGVVTVTIAGRTVTTTPSPSDGSWSVTSPTLANGAYPVVASTTDGAGNPGTATQQLTIDTVPPVVTLDGGPSVTTNDPTPTISGTSDVAPGTVVRITVDLQALTALVQLGGSWNVTPSSLTDGTRTVTAAVSDPAGNMSTATQALTVDTTAPAVTITGGSNALSNDATPDISGTAAVAPGTTVTVTVADQTLTGLVQAGGAWSVTAAPLADGPHRVLMSVADAAGNPAGLSQTLTVDTVAPVVAITGGASAATTDRTPTITGTTDAAAGTTVTITIAGQTMTTLVQASGSWNATPASVGEGTWHVVASAPDPAGNTGVARQALTIVIGAPPPGPPGGASGQTGNTGPGATSGSTGTTGQTGTARPTGSPGSTGASGAGSRVSVWLSAASYAIAHGRRLGVRFVISGAAKLTLTVFRGKRAVAKLGPTRRRAGRGSLTWDGKIKRKPARRGTYKIMIQAASAAGTSTTDSAMLRIT